MLFAKALLGLGLAWAVFGFGIVHNKDALTESYNQAFLKKFPRVRQLVKQKFPNYKGKYLFNLAKVNTTYTASFLHSN